MEQFEQNIYSLRELKNWLHSVGEIAVYGAGDYGKRLIDYLYLIKEDARISGIIVTEKKDEQKYRGIEIFALSDFVRNIRICPVIIAVSSHYREELVGVASQYCLQYRCLTLELYKDMGMKMNPLSVSYSGIDFLCPGFVKCGTSSLYDALRTVNGIYLSARKENHFFEWCSEVEDAKEILVEKYFDNIMKGQKVGIVDPTYAWEAKKTYDFFGKDIKIIFLVRNPIDATFSEFKMAMRDGWPEWDKSYQKYGGVFNVGMFDEYFEKDAADFEYIKWIGQFERYYLAKQLKVVFLEELIKEPKVVINDILDFIGVSTRYENDKLPKINEGNYVMADLAGHELARLRGLELHRQDRCLSLHEVRKRRYQEQDKRLKIDEEYRSAKKYVGVQMTTEQRMKVKKYYGRSVRELGDKLNKDLTEVWF